MTGQTYRRFQAQAVLARLGGVSPESSRSVAAMPGPPRGSLTTVVHRQVEGAGPCLAAESGYVLCATHSRLATVSPENAIVTYRAAAAIRVAGRSAKRSRMAVAEFA